ncbi:MAG: amino acid ABC transporter substrate-binding protein [Geminicoccaceae bacterium]|nr:amino acid ABC transporter substrate-binding protein [Geminicoccaceae bacterium]
MRMKIVVGALLLALAPPLGAQELTGTLKKIKDAGEIVIGHRESSVPFSYINDQGEPEGYSIDLCMAVVDRVKEEIGADDLRVRMVPVNPQTRIPLLANGTIDIECGSTTNNLTRQQQVDYSPITFITGTQLLVKKDSGIEEIEDLEGKAIAVAQGTTNERAVKGTIEEKGLDVDVLNVKDHAEGFLALQTDRVDAYSTDHVLLHGLVSKAKNPDDYAVVGRFLSYDPYALMVPRDDSAFRLVVNKTLSDLFRSGEIFTIYQKWFDGLGVPTTNLLEAAFAIQALPE